MDEITESNITADVVSFRYRGREIEGPAAEAKDLLAECLYQTMHAKKVEVFDDDMDDDASSAPSWRVKSRYTVLLEDVFSKRLFPVRLPGKRDSDNDSVVADHRGIAVRCQSNRIIGGNDSSGYDVLVEHYSGTVSPGFFFIYGKGTLSGIIHHPERTYISVVNPDAAVDLAPVLVAALDALSLDYCVKFLTDENEYPRTDTVVIYHELVEPVHDALRSVVVNTGISTGQVSDYCVEVGPGIGRAQEPIGRFGGGRSFGQHRSRMLAEIVIDTLCRPDGELLQACHRICDDYAVEPECISLNRA
ncbi:T3SS effector HopA1 family protein [Nocardia sp. NPDC051463]|uniref:T3SS effector HopA1 family protein n=1 Tax=Nocardia sp. NPDC051463 TaxID=3154845 RepID=UPI00344F728D